jgi:hypothetical protein
MRVHRGGGLTKDAVYLMGLLELLKYLREGGDVQRLFVGKMAAEHIPIIEELRLRKILKPIPLRPTFLDDPLGAQRLAKAQAGIDVLELVEECKL